MRGSVAKCERLLRRTRNYQTLYRKSIRSLPSTVNYSHWSPRKLARLARAMKNEKKAGEATWALYQIQKKLCNYCNAYEDLIAFLVEHFVCKEDNGLQERIEELKFAETRGYLRDLGPRMIKLHSRATMEAMGQ